MSSADQRYIQLAARLNTITDRGAISIVLLTFAMCATSWSRLGLALAVHAVIYPGNLVFDRWLLPKYGARVEIPRVVFNGLLAAVGYQLIDWPLAVWLWLPFNALTNNQYGGKHSLTSACLMCIIMSAAGIAGGVDWQFPLTFSLLALLAWQISNTRLAIVREMLEESERQRIERERIEGELVEMSRRAGMAEIATNVLHDVGNVLNSLNVSVSMVGEQLRTSKVSSLGKTVELYSAHPDGLTGFLGTDKGHVLPQFLSAISAALVEENARERRELEQVSTNVEHIKNIIATQQAYARSKGFFELVQLAAIVEAALQVAPISTARNPVEIVRDFEPVPDIMVDRHKTLQIIVNLVRNAVRAVDDQGGGRVTLQLRQNDTHVMLHVVDTGTGIAVENLDRIFQHGFTTKSDGHGFGLHGSSNAARALGGELSVHSEGEGHGATFTLQLPLERGSHALAN